MFPAPHFVPSSQVYLQQRSPKATVHDLITQLNVLKMLKRLGSTIRFKRPALNKQYKFSILTFADASRKEDHGQLGYIAGLLIGDLKNGSVVHTLSWHSTKSKRPVKSVASAEVLATGSAIDEAKMLMKAYETLFSMDVSLVCVLDSKDLFDTISSCRMATDRSIRGDVALIRFEFETRTVSRMIWLPGKSNFADPLTKLNSPISSALQLMMFSGALPCDFNDVLVRDSDGFTG